MTSYGGDVTFAMSPTTDGSKRMAGKGRSLSCGPSGFVCFSATLDGSDDLGIRPQREQQIVSAWACPLRTSEEPLVTAYDCAMLDLDGVVYIGPHAVEEVPDVLAQARDLGMTLAFVTNNAARTPADVAGHLRELGVEARAEDVVTSAQAAAREVAERVPPGAKVLVVGGEGLETALKEHDLVPVSSADDDPAAVVQGFHRSVGWELLAEGAYAIRSGLPWIASNLDLTVPTARGIAPGNGALVGAVATAVGREPDIVAGKPYRPLFDETVRRISSRRPLVIGDRLDTDIEGAVTVRRRRAAGDDRCDRRRGAVPGQPGPATVVRRVDDARPAARASGSRTQRGRMGW